jgi:hypothetical protein
MSPTSAVDNTTITGISMNTAATTFSTSGLFSAKYVNVLTLQAFPLTYSSFTSSNINFQNLTGGLPAGLYYMAMTDQFGNTVNINNYTSGEMFLNVGSTYGIPSDSNISLNIPSTKSVSGASSNVTALTLVNVNNTLNGSSLSSISPTLPATTTSVSYSITALNMGLFSVFSTTGGVSLSSTHVFSAIPSSVTFTPSTAVHGTTITGITATMAYVYNGMICLLAGTGTYQLVQSSNSSTQIFFNDIIGGLLAGTYQLYIYDTNGYVQSGLGTTVLTVT